MLDGEFNWDNYKKECTGMRQSEAPPDGLWAKCEPGEKHDAADEYEVRETEENGKSRRYCIDGCSTPSGVVAYLVSTGDFLFANKDNPTGTGPGGYGEASSFYGSCAAHDKCYQTCSSNDQKACDDDLLKKTLAVCDTVSPRHVTPMTDMFSRTTYKPTRTHCYKAANAMHTGLRSWLEVSKAAFKKRRQQYCQCC